MNLWDLKIWPKSPTVHGDSWHLWSFMEISPTINGDLDGYLVTSNGNREMGVPSMGVLQLVLFQKKQDFLGHPQKETKKIVRKPMDPLMNLWDWASNHWGSYWEIYWDGAKPEKNILSIHCKMDNHQQWFSLNFGAFHGFSLKIHQQWIWALTSNDWDLGMWRCQMLIWEWAKVPPLKKDTGTNAP